MVATNVYPRDLQTLLQALPGLTPTDTALIERAYHKAEQAHEGQRRKSGEPYFTHCVAVAGILSDLKMDSETIAAGLLHDTIEDTPVTREELRIEFGENIARLVDGVTKLTKLPQSVGLENNDHKRSSSTNKNVEAFRKMLLTMDDDVRVVLVKLADRLHNMRTLGYMPVHKQVKVARETLEIYAPLANRLGIWQIKWELEDLSFRYLQPDTYRMIAKKLDEKRADREQYMARIADVLRVELEKFGIHNAVITARPKHIYSIHRKMQRKDLPLDQIYDIRAVRVIVEEEIQCYTVLALAHKLWRPIPGQFDDYVASPKDNFYRSLHTAVLDNNGKTVEVQIRTWEMHEDAEYGIAAHWRYKEDRRSGADESFEKRIAYLRRLMEFGTDSVAGEDANEFMTRMREDVFPDRVLAFTPKGDIIDLPSGATPIDFAYHIHTEIGHRCRGARIHGKLVPLDQALKMGDQVEILTAKRGGPSMDWLNESLGYVRTSRARTKIRHWFRKQHRDKHITLGRTALEREMKRLGVLDKMSFEAVANLFSIDAVDDFMAAIGAGDVTGAQITHRVLEDEERRRKQVSDFKEEILKPRTRPSLKVDTSHGVNIMGTGGLLVNIAKCCSPTPGDGIIGYITRGRGVTVHRTDCPNIQNIPDTERLIDVSWGGDTHEHIYTVPVEIIAHDRSGLLRDISTMIADEKVNISGVDVTTRHYIAKLCLDIEINDKYQLARILTKLEQIPNVVEARRRN